VLAAGVAAAGCGTRSGPIAIDLRYQAWMDTAPRARAAPCRVAVRGVEDERSNREHLGVIGSAPVHADRVPEWIADGLGRLVGQRRLVRVGGPASAGGEDVVGDVAIRHVYARTAVSQLEGVVVLGARFTRRPGAVIEREYRRSAHRLNWFGAGGEVVMVLNEALSDVVRRIGNDVPRVCGPARSGAKALPTGIEHSFQATPAVHQAGFSPGSVPCMGESHRPAAHSLAHYALTVSRSPATWKPWCCTHPPSRSW
jgi:hypothetical protein